MTILRSAAMFVVLGSALAAQAQKVTLRYNPAVGKTYVFSTTTTMKQTMPQGASNMKQSMTTTMKVLKKAGDKVTIQTTVSGAKVTATGQGAEMASGIEKQLNSTKSTTVIDSRGRPADIKATGPQAMQSALSGMAGGLGSMNSFPEGPVGVGSTWTSTIDFQKMMKGMLQGMKMSGGKIPVKMTLKRFETAGGKRLAVIDVVLNGNFSLNPPAGNASAMGPVTTTLRTNATMKVDVATGVPVEVQSKGGGTTSIGKMKLVQDITTSMKLIR
jgi:hypothetical protein